MKIAFVMTVPVVSITNGIRVQAITWKKGLEDVGHEVDLVDMWNVPDWKQYDIIQCFGYGGYMPDFVRSVRGTNANIALAPIIDSNYSVRLFRMASFWGSKKLRLSNDYIALRRVKEHIKLYLVRSEYEKRFIVEAYSVDESRVALIPLSYRLDPPAVMPEKEPFCFHLGLLADDRKNVGRIIEAAEKYDFKLKLAGKLRNDAEREKLERWMNGSKNVEYLGFVSDGQLHDLYSRARVFALPSTYEGVGLAALDAAVFGCDIVITSLGGPKEYYPGVAAVVDPYSVDDIGRAVREFIDGKTFQPGLREYAGRHFSLGTTMQLLTDKYIEILGTDK